MLIVDGIVGFSKTIVYWVRYLNQLEVQGKGLVYVLKDKADHLLQGIGNFFRFVVSKIITDCQHVVWNGFNNTWKLTKNLSLPLRACLLLIGLRAATWWLRIFVLVIPKYGFPVSHDRYQIDLKWPIGWS